MNFRPSTIVETGVCNGFSTSIILKALEDIGEGKLYSIDLPETPETDPNKFWEGKGGAIVPTDKKPGWLVPEEYRSRWEFIEGNSLYKLPKVMKEIEELDVFIHDSEHSYEMMMFEFSLAWKHLKRNGLIISDDITWNPAFKHFSKGKKLKKYKSGSLGILKKRK